MFPNVDAAACEAFFETHSVFTADEFHAHLAAQRRRGSAQQRARALHAYVRAGRLHRLKRGLYALRPAAEPVDQEPVVSLLQVAARMTPDAVLAYHTALECYGLAHNVWFHVLYAARKPAKPLRLTTGLVRGAAFARALQQAGREHQETTLTPKNGLRITTVERTLVDIADRPRLCGNWSEIARGYSYAAHGTAFGLSLPDVNRMIAYALVLNNAFTCAKVGFLLDMHGTEWGLDSVRLQPLIAACPRRPRHLDPRYADMPASLVAPWNLIVPLWVQQRDWDAY